MAKSPEYRKLEDFPKKQRVKIFQENQHRCIACEIDVEDGDGCEITQFTGRTTGGTSELGNQILLCKDCKEDRKDFRVKLPPWMRTMIEKKFETEMSEGAKVGTIAKGLILESAKQYFSEGGDGLTPAILPHRLIILDEEDQKKAISLGLEEKRKELEELSETSAEVSKMISNLEEQFSGLANELVRKEEIFHNAARVVTVGQFLKELRYQMGETNNTWVISKLGEIPAEEKDYIRVKRSELIFLKFEEE